MKAVWLAFPVVALLAGCVAPAPADSAYESKAARTASSAKSALETARLAVQLAAKGRVTHAYLETAITEAEDDYGSVQSTFDSVQPPSTSASDDLRTKLDQLLQQGAAGLTSMRIAVRRDQQESLAKTEAGLQPVADRLGAFAEEHAS